MDNTTITPIRVGSTNTNPKNGEYWTTAPDYLETLIILTVHREGVPFLVYDPQSPQIVLSVQEGIMYVSSPEDEIAILDTLELVQNQMHQSNPTPLSFLDMVRMFDRMYKTNGYEGRFVVLKKVLESTQLTPFFEGSDWSGWKFSKNKNGRRSFAYCREEVAVTSILTNVHPGILRLWIDLKEFNNSKLGVAQLETMIDSVDSWVGYREFFYQAWNKLSGAVHDSTLLQIVALVAWSGKTFSAEEILRMTSTKFFHDPSSIDGGTTYPNFAGELEWVGFGHVLKTKKGED